MKNLIVSFLIVMSIIACNKSEPEPKDVKIGDLYEGGIVCDIQSDYILIAATADYPSNVTWNNGSFPLTNATDRGYGYNNTNTIIAVQGNTGIYAAKVCKDMGDGWYLPASNEMYWVKQALEIFGVYWTSTEWTDTKAHCSPQLNSDHPATTKSSLNRVRAVKRIPL